MKKSALICVTRNNHSKLETMLSSILKHTNQSDYDLFLIDNASQDTTLDLYARNLGAHVTLVRSNFNRNWVGAINLGLEFTRSYRFVGLLNDDIQVGSGWLAKMTSILERNPRVGAVGPLTSNTRDWQSYDRVRHLLPNICLPELSHIDRNDVDGMARAVDRNSDGLIVSGMLAFFCTIMRRSVMDSIGHLDMDFNDLFLGDDDEYCDRMQKAGFLLALSTNTYVAHLSGTSSSSVPDFECRRKKALELLALKKRLNEQRKV